MKFPLLQMMLILYGLGLTVKGAGNLSPILVWDAGSLGWTKQAIQKEDPRWLPAYQQLLKEAEAALEIRRLSVVDKTGPVPSGDPHDYVSIGIYWWPNPDTEEGLPYVRRDGERNPAAGGTRLTHTEPFKWQMRSRHWLWPGISAGRKSMRNMRFI